MAAASGIITQASNHPVEQTVEALKRLLRARSVSPRL